MEHETGRHKEPKQHHRRRSFPKESGMGNRSAPRPEGHDGARSRAKRIEPTLVPLERISSAREMMLAALKAPRAVIRRITLRLRKEYPGRTPKDVQGAFRRMRENRGPLKGRHVTVSEEELDILRAGYAAGPVAARAARKKLLRLRPDLNRGQVGRIVRRLGLAKRRAPAKRWSHDDHGYLMLWCGEKEIQFFVKKFRRTAGAIRTRLSRYGASARVRGGRRYNLREAAALFGVSRTTVSNWIVEGKLDAVRRRRWRAITEDSMRTSCERYPEKIDRTLCSPEVLDWLPTPKAAVPLNGRRGHLAHPHTCPKCGRKIQGNGYSTHEKSCGLESESSTENV
jgi:hypothetical protein